MTDIFYNYSLGHKCHNRISWILKLSIQIQLDRDRNYNSRMIKDCKYIDDVIQILKSNSTISNLDISHFFDFYFEVIIEDKHFILSYKYRVLEIEEFKRERFEPYIKYDIDDIRKNTIKPIEYRLFLECNSVKEQIELIKHYLSKPRRRFSKWGIKPKVLYLYHTYGEEPEKFVINYD